MPVLSQEERPVSKIKTKRSVKVGKEGGGGAVGPKKKRIVEGKKNRGVEKRYLLQAYSRPCPITSRQGRREKRRGKGSNLVKVVKKTERNEKKTKKKKGNKNGWSGESRTGPPDRRRGQFGGEGGGTGVRDVDIKSNRR